MEQGFFQTYKNFDGIKDIVYTLKGRFDNLTVFPLEDFGDDVFALTIGEQWGSTILCGGFNDNDCLTTPLLLGFVEELLSVLELSGAICSITPTKLLQERSLTIIPWLSSPGKDFSQQMELVTSLFQEWGSKRLYCFSQQTGKNIIRYPTSENTPPHTHLMAQMLASSCGYASMSASPEQAPQLHNFCKQTAKPVFEIVTGRESLPLPVKELEDFYQRLRELFMLTLVL